MSFTGNFLPVEIVFEIALFLSPKELRSWLCANSRMAVDYFQVCDGRSEYARKIFFKHFRAGSRLSEAEVKKSKWQQMVSPILSCFGYSSKKMLMNDENIRDLYKETEELLNSPYGITWEEFNEKFLYIENMVGNQKILKDIDDKWLRLELASRLSHLAEEREAWTVQKYLWRIIHENLKSFYQEANLPENIERLNDEWCEHRHVRLWPDNDLNKVHAYIVWFFVHVDFVNNKEEIRELFGKIQSILIYNLGDFGIKIFHCVLSRIGESSQSKKGYPVPGQRKKDWNKLLRWYFDNPKLFERACDSLCLNEKHINHLLGKHVNAKMLFRILSQDDIGIKLLERYIKDPEKLRKLCDYCSKNNVFMQALFDIAHRARLLYPFCIALSKDHHSIRPEKNYEFIFKELPLMIGEERSYILIDFVVSTQMKDINQYFIGYEGHEWRFLNTLRQLHKISFRLADLLLDNFLLLPDSDSFMRWFMHRLIEDYWMNPPTRFYKINPSFVVKIIHRLLNLSYEIQPDLYSICKFFMEDRKLTINCTLAQRNLVGFMDKNFSNEDRFCGSIECIGVYWPTIINTLLQDDKFCKFLGDPKSLACFLLAVDPRLLPFIIKRIEMNEKLVSAYNEFIEIPGVKECLIRELDEILQSSEWSIFNRYYLLNVDYKGYSPYDEQKNYVAEKTPLSEIKEWRDTSKHTNVCIIKSAASFYPEPPVYLCNKANIVKKSHKDFYKDHLLFLELHPKLNPTLRIRCKRQIDWNTCGELLGYKPICTTEKLKDLHDNLQNLVDEKQQNISRMTPRTTV
jgi:hypothetical protein